MIISKLKKLTGTLWISDKESRQGIAARILYLPSQAIEQVKCYLNYLEVLHQRYRFEDTVLAKRIEQALNGTGSLFFGRYANAQDYQTTYTTPQNSDLRRQFAIRPAHEYSTEIIELTPKYISEQTDRILPLPNNWNRHYMRNKLIEYGVQPTIVDAWMGHEPIGAEGFGRFSNLATADLKNVAITIAQIFTAMAISPITIVRD